MINLSINRNVTIVADFSADQWCLYTVTVPKKKIDETAKTLNGWLEYYVNSGASRDTVFEGMYKIMQEHSKHGASDSEPYHFLERVLDEIYAKDSK